MTIFTKKLLFVLCSIYLITPICFANDYYWESTRKEKIPPNTPLDAPFITFNIDENDNETPADIDFKTDCGLLPSDEEDYHFSKSVAKVKDRINWYPILLKAFNSFNEKEKALFFEMKDISSQLFEMIDKDISLAQKKEQSKPLLRKIEGLSFEIAQAANINFEGGCGAGEDDSQPVTFTTEPKAKVIKFITAFDYKACKGINANPVDFNQCDTWEDVLKDEPYYLSGEYHYYAEWNTESSRTGRFSVLSTKPMNLRIEM